MAGAATVVVTGAGGFIGRAACATLEARGCAVRGLVRSLSIGTAARPEYLAVGDLARLPDESMRNAMRGARMANVKSIPNTGPEIRPLGERCFISFGSQGGPPLNNTMYNNNLQIVQTPTSVMIDIEMNHDARVINMTDKSGVGARPDAVRQWFGDSVGHWEGDTMVVVTRNFSASHQRMAAFPVSDKGKVTERFTRVSDDVIDYQFEVSDPVFYTQTWTGQIPLRRSKEHVFEYACHEGNYAMPGILRADSQGKDTAIQAEGE